MDPVEDRIIAEKQRIRRQILDARSQISPGPRESKNRQILKRILESDIYRHATIIHTYVSRPDEVDTHGLIMHSLKAGKKVVVPRVVQGSTELQHFFITRFDDLIPGTFKILEPDPAKCEPAPLENIDGVFVPGVAFDRRGNRLGFGKGFYDQFLARLAAPRIGLCFSLQIVASLPTREADVAMDYLVTESEWIETHARSFTHFGEQVHGTWT